MKRLLPLLLALVLLAGCAKTPTSSPGSVSSEQSAPPGTTSSAPTGSSGDEEAPVTGWQKVYLDTLNDLSAQYGRYVLPEEEHLPVTGLKFARLLDFNNDGVRELVVLIDRTVQLYTCREEQAVLLYEGEAGAYLGQGDVGYVFHLNTQGDTSCLILYHSQSEWTEEAITIVHLSGEGSVVTTELYASIAEGEPGREYLSGFSINGEAVSAEVYNAVRTAALDESVTVEAYTEAQQDSVVVSQKQLDKLFYALEHWDGYLLPDADARYYSQEELSQLTARELRLARNEIYARHGRTFHAADLVAYFEDKEWYLPLYTPEEFDAIAFTLLNRYELSNLAALMAVENSGTHAANGEMLSEEEALAIAEAYWDFHEGKLDPETGFLLSISADAVIAVEEASYYVFRLHLLENNDYWVSREMLYVDAHSGLTSTSIPE